MPGMDKTMHEFKQGKLHSGSKHGPEVKSRKQAIAIGLSEARKAGEKVAPKHHSFASSNQPFGQTREGEMAAHHIEQGHKVAASGANRHDGAGRKGHDMEMHNKTEHKAPEHRESHAPSRDNSTFHPNDHREGAYGYPGKTLSLGSEGTIVGKQFGPGETPEASEVSAHGPGPNGYPGHHASLEPKAHGFGHGAHQRAGLHRLSGHPGAHRIGKR